MASWDLSTRIYELFFKVIYPNGIDTISQIGVVPSVLDRHILHLLFVSVL
jgi:hypothetical protein